MEVVLDLTNAEVHAIDAALDYRLADLSELEPPTDPAKLRALAHAMKKWDKATKVLR